MLQLSPHPHDVWTLGDAFEGTVVFGRSGSGKTSGSGAAIAKAFLRSGMGGLVLCAKPDEADLWQRYAQETGRSSSVIRFDTSGQWRFNFLEYDMQREELSPDLLASNVVATLMSVLEVAGRAGGLEAASQGDAFWPKAMRLLLTRAVDLLYATTGRVRLGEIMALIESAPKSRSQLADDHWRSNSFFYQIFRDFYATGGGAYPPDPEEIRRLDQFWRISFPEMPEKTRGNILTTLQTDLEPLLRPNLRKIFATDTNLVPELSHDGAIILLDFPVLKLNEAGVLAQMIFKYLWMRATQRREVTSHTRPVFLWADECQLFLSSYDMEFQSTARSSRTATVLMTQNLPSFYSRIGGQRPEHTVNAMMGNLKTKIFHNNQDATTNEWAANLIGKTSVWRTSVGSNQGWSSSTNHGESFGRSFNESLSDSSSDGFNSSSGPTGITSGYNSGTGESDSRGYSTSHTASQGSAHSQSGGQSEGQQEQWDYAVHPHEFATDLQTGGSANQNLVTGVVVLPGRNFQRNGKHWMTVGFPQGAAD